MFEKASRLKLRFIHCGQIAVEDLWDLDLKVLDSLHCELRTEQRKHTEESLLTSVLEPNKDDEILSLSVDLVKHVVKTRLKEAEIIKNRAIAKLRREKLSTIIQEKEDEGLKALPLEELKDALADLG